VTQISEAIEDHWKICKEELPKKFVPWTWVVGICMILLTAIGASVWGLSDRFSVVNIKVENALQKNVEQDARIVELRAVAEYARETRDDVKEMKSLIKKLTK
jgi:hypothetical protein